MTTGFVPHSPLATRMGIGFKDVGQNGITVAMGDTEIDGLSVTFDAVAGRRYRVESLIRVTMFQANAALVPTRALAGVYEGAGLANWFGVMLDLRTVCQVGADISYTGTGFSYYNAEDSGELTFALAIRALEAGTTLNVDDWSWFAVYDDGAW